MHRPVTLQVLDTEPVLCLRKLWWFRLTDDTSERQWRDVVALLRSTSVDTADVLATASEVGLADLAQQAIAEATP